MTDKKPNLPDGTWAVTAEDKKEIVSFGRELSKFIFDYIAKLGKDKFHAKIVAGGFQYFMDIQAQKSKLIGDDVVIAQETLEKYSLGNKIDEPFVDVEIVPESKEAKIERLKKEIEILEAPETPVADTEVEDASITPSSNGGSAPIEE